MRLVHRVAWELANGPIPDGMKVCHRCDNPPCCNPAHLFLGTIADNNADRDQKGRQVSLQGEEHGSAKLTADQVDAIRELASADVPQELIARAVGIHKSHVSLISRGKTWASRMGEESQ
ncbi:HNH endonuclease [Streptosporangium sp. NPDC001681]|uniref:HNH endonuclease n=1 Tax=Streptosporangium sp. NPDC001681 TaxID=3154395 RepID=UPI0033258784